MFAHVRKLCLVVQETVADELEEAYRSHIWNPAQRHVKEHKSGVTAARVELTTLHHKVRLTSFLFPVALQLLRQHQHLAPQRQPCLPACPVFLHMCCEDLTLCYSVKAACISRTLSQLLWAHTFQQCMC